MRGGQSGQNGQSDQTTNFFWIIALVFGLIVVTWWLFRSVIVTPIFWVRYHEIDLLNYVVHGLNQVMLAVHLKPISMTHLDHLQNYIAITDPRQVVIKDFFNVNLAVGKVIRYPVMAILLIAAGLLFTFHRSARFRQTYSMQSLRKLESENWPEITPILSENLLKEDLDKGPWAMSQLPLEFCKQNNIVHVKEKEERLVWGIDKGAAYRAFTMQMGQLWPGVDRLPIHVKALLVIFVARAHKEPKVARELLRQIAASAKHGKLDFSNVEKLYDNYKSSKLIVWLEKRHAYLYGMMASMLEISRSDGVLATAEFLWLKPVDRRLWYMLNTVGRQTAVVEIAGPYAHWLAEKRLKRAIRLPMVKQAVTALEIDMESTLHVPAEDKWHSAA